MTDAAQQARDAKRQARFDGMTDAEIATEKAKYEADLDRLTGGSGDVAYMKSNSIRFLWTEQMRRAALAGG